MPRWCRLALMWIAAVLAGGPAFADELRFFQLGTGPTAETRFPMGGLIANALSNPPGSRECERGGSCGVAGLVAVAKSTEGSAANVEALRARRLDAALVHTDIAFWAYHGIGPFKGRAAPNLRGIAAIYPEYLHLVTRRDSGIRTPADLKGKKVSLGEAESALSLHGRQILGAWGVADKVKVLPMATAAAAQALAEGRIDALLALDGPPLPVLSELARNTAIALVPLDGGAAERMRAQNPYLVPGTIPADTYEGQFLPVPTLTIAVALLAPAEEDEALVRGVTRALWHPSTQKLLRQGNPRGRLVHLDADSLPALGIPLHPGAAAYYAEAAGH